MSKVICEREDLVAVADAIRNKTGETNQMTLNEMSNYINSISIGNKEGHATIYLKDISMAFTCSCECLLNDLSYYNQALKNNMNAFVAWAPSIIKFTSSSGIKLPGMTSSNNEGSHYFIDFKNSEKILNLKSYGGMIMQDTVALVVDDGAEIIVKYIKTDENEPT